MILVVDASVAAKWALNEEHAEAAARIAGPRFALRAPELLWVEVAAALRRRLRRGELTAADLREAVTDMRSWNVETRAIRPLVEPAVDLSSVLDHAVHDCVYLALAEVEGCPVVTADRRLHDKVERSPFAGLTMWIGDVPR